MSAILSAARPATSNALRWALVAAVFLLLPIILHQGARTGTVAQGLAGVSIALLCVHAAAILGLARAATRAEACTIEIWARSGPEQARIGLALRLGVTTFTVTPHLSVAESGLRQAP